MSESIVQLSTPRIVSAIHVIRFSGEKCLAFLQQHTGLKKIVARKVYYSTLFKIDNETENKLESKSDKNNKKNIDDVICFYFSAPHSYSGEDMLEIHCHGSLVIVDEILSLAKHFGFLLAERGEFTKRAFLNGKYSVEQVEAINSLIHSKSNFTKQNALNILEKKSSLKLVDVEKKIINMISQLEAGIEFPEEDIPIFDFDKKKIYKKYSNQIEEINNYFEQLIFSYEKGKKIENGFTLAIIGAPNAGKSTLMNLLLREERAIVSEIQGTTRDYLKESIQIDGIPFHLFDTAGIRFAEDEIEKIGIEKTFEIIEQSDIICQIAFTQKCLEDFFELKQKYPKKEFLIFVNKNDLLKEKEKENLEEIAKQKNTSLTFFSLKENSKKAIIIVEQNLKKVAREKISLIDEDNIFLLNERQKSILQKCQSHFLKIKDLITSMEQEEILTEEFKNCRDLLQEINIQVGNQKVFDNLFKSFCIGK